MPISATRWEASIRPVMQQLSVAIPILNDAGKLDPLQRQIGTSVNRGPMVRKEFWYPNLNGPVNKRDLSTGENGEFSPIERAAGSIGVARKPLPRVVGELQKPQTMRNVWDTHGVPLRSDAVNKTAWPVVQGRSGSPPSTRTTIHSSEKLFLLP